MGRRPFAVLTTLPTYFETMTRPRSISVPVVLTLCATLAVACENGQSATNSTKDTNTATALHDAVAKDSATKDSLARARQDSINRTLPGYVIDSILPVEEQLRRFRASIGGETVTALQHGSASRDALVNRFVKALVAGDSVELRAMALTPREFADLVYPESPNTKPPYQQDPALVWRTIQNPSESGFIRLVRRAGGVPVTLKSYRCDPKAVSEGKNRLWGNCVLTLVGEKGDTSTHRFFGSILERGGQFKFMSYKNEF